MLFRKSLLDRRGGKFRGVTSSANWVHCDCTHLSLRMPIDSLMCPTCKSFGVPCLAKLSVWGMDQCLLASHGMVAALWNRVRFDLSPPVLVAVGLRVMIGARPDDSAFLYCLRHAVGISRFNSSFSANLAQNPRDVTTLLPSHFQQSTAQRTPLQPLI